MFKWIKRIFTIGKCCGDCKYFSKCWGSYNHVMADAPTCKDFKESKHES